MATRIRLQRHGKKGKPYYHIVAADQRSKRDGRIIEQIGSYNPNTNPATIELDFDRALYWYQAGAQPSDTANAILKYKGILYRDHLDRGVKKGALTEEQANAKFESWMKDKEARIQAKVDGINKAASDAKAKTLADESAKNEAKRKEVLAKNSPVAEAVEGEEGAEVATEEAPVAEAEVAAKAPVAEEAAPEAAPAEEAAPEAEAKEEAPAAEAAPAEEAAPEAEVKEEAPAAEEAPAEEAAPEAEAKEEAPAEEAAPEAKADDSADAAGEEDAKKEG